MLQKSQNYLMNQNYNSLLSPNKNSHKLDFQHPVSRPVQREALFEQTTPKSEERVVKVSRESLLKEIEVFSWRSRTSLPILKMGHYAIFPLVHPLPARPIFKTDPSLILSPNKTKEEAQNTQKMTAYVGSHPEVASYEVRAKTEEIKCTLQDIELLAIPQIIYLLKETLIGFELLIDIFGVFEPTQRMILINHRHQWRVWINEDYILSAKETPKISEKEFICTIIKFVEAHAPTTTQSKHLFHTLIETTYNHECSFIRVLEKVNEFAAVNKIFHVNKVVFSNQRVVSRESNKFVPHGFQLSQVDTGDNLKALKANLQKLTTSPLIDSKTPKKQGLVQFSSNIRSTNNLLPDHSIMHSPSYTNLQTYCKPNVSYNFAPLSPPALNFSQKNDPKQSQFDHFCDNWQKGNAERESVQTPVQSKYMARKHFTTGVDFSQIIYSPKANLQSHYRPSCNPNPKHNNNIKQVSTIVPHADMKKTTMANLSPAKNRKEMKQIFHEKVVQHRPIINVQSKPVSRLDEGPQKRNNKRKYSQQLIQIKSLDHLSNKEKCGHISNIYSPNDQIRSFNKIHEGVMVATPTPKTMAKELDSSPDVRGISSPNNSSSTKEIQQSGELKANYTKLKMKDLGGDKPKNNQSVINTYSMVHVNDPKKDKNMAVSYQFQNNEDDSSDSERSLKRAPRKKETKWSNKISGLFSDSVSIKHLKESIRIKTKEEQHFEKQYLKDVKLDLLEKFGRKANLVEEDDGRQHAPYKSMQLIEEELEEGKSYLDEDMKYEDFPSKETRSKNHTMQISPQGFQQQQKKAEARECNSQYDDNDLSSEMASSSSSSCDNGFDFETEMYSINPPH